jgi:hypothetical protein
VLQNAATALPGTSAPQSSADKHLFQTSWCSSAATPASLLLLPLPELLLHDHLLLLLSMSPPPPQLHEQVTYPPQQQHQVGTAVLQNQGTPLLLL